MKRLAVFAAAAAVCSVALADMKIATVDMMVLMRNHSAYETNRKLLTDSQADSEKRLADQKKRLDDIEDEARRLGEEYRNPMLAASAKAKIEEKMADAQKRYLALQSKLRADAANDQRSLADMESSLLKSQAEDLRKIVARFAKDGGYDLVISADAVVFGGTTDVTRQVLTAMGVDPDKARTREDFINEGK